MIIGSTNGKKTTLGSRRLHASGLALALAAATFGHGAAAQDEGWDDDVYDDTATRSYDLPASSGNASGTAGATPSGSLEDQLSIVGTIHGGDSPALTDTAVVLDVVSGQTHVLTVGQCLPRLPDACIREVRDRTALFAQGGRTVEVGRIDGAVPRSDVGGGYTPGGFDVPPPPPPPPPPYDDYVEPVEPPPFDGMPPPPFDGMPPPPPPPGFDDFPPPPAYDDIPPPSYEDLPRMPPSGLPPPPPPFTDDLG